MIMLVDVTYILIGIWMVIIIHESVQDLRKELSYVPEPIINFVAVMLSLFTLVAWPIVIVCGACLMYSDRAKKARAR